MELLTDKLDRLAEMAVEYAPKLAGAILVLIVGLILISYLTKVFRMAMKNAQWSQDLVPFLCSMFSVVMKVLLLFSVVQMLGVKTTSFVALLGMAGLAIGMALQGTLQHFAAGVMVLIFRPYKVGDLVEIKEQVGHVEEIQIFNTLMRTLDNKQVIVPNGIAISDVLTNLSTHEALRVDLEMAMTYESDFDVVQQIILDAVKSTPKVLSEPAPMVEILAFDESAVKLCVRPYATPEDYWEVYFGCYRNAKRALTTAKVSVPYPREIEVVVEG